jgi:DNA invertase Pin-like site-specific DNA recombinase
MLAVTEEPGELTPEDIETARRVRSAQTRAGIARAKAEGRQSIPGPGRDLTPADDSAIRAAFDAGARVLDLSKQYGKSINTIYRSLRRTEG